MGRRAGVSRFNFKTYYQKNKDKLAEKRKQKYLEDPEFRKAQLMRTATAYAEKKRRVQPSDRKKIGEFISVGKVSELLKVNVHQIRNYHKIGLIPEPSAVDSRGWRLYTKRQAILMMKVFAFLKKKEMTKAEVAVYLAENWEEKTVEDNK